MLNNRLLLSVVSSPQSSSDKARPVQISGSDKGDKVLKPIRISISHPKTLQPTPEAAQLSEYRPVASQSKPASRPRPLAATKAKGPVLTVLQSKISTTAASNRSTQARQLTVRGKSATATTRQSTPRAAESQRSREKGPSRSQETQRTEEAAGRAQTADHPEEAASPVKEAVPKTATAVDDVKERSRTEDHLDYDEDPAVQETSEAAVEATVCSKSPSIEPEQHAPVTPGGEDLKRIHELQREVAELKKENQTLHSQLLEARREADRAISERDQARQSPKPSEAAAALQAKLEATEKDKQHYKRKLGDTETCVQEWKRRCDVQSRENKFALDDLRCQLRDQKDTRCLLEKRTCEVQHLQEQLHWANVAVGNERRAHSKPLLIVDPNSGITRTFKKYFFYRETKNEYVDRFTAEFGHPHSKGYYDVIGGDAAIENRLAW